MSDQLSHQQQTEMDLYASEEEYGQELEQEGGGEAELSCPEPESVSASFLPPPESGHNCFCSSPMTSKPHHYEHYRHSAHSGHTARRRLPSSSPVSALPADGNTSAAIPHVPLPPESQQKIEQEDLDFKLRAHGYAKITLPGNHRFPGSAPQGSVCHIPSGSPERSSSWLPVFPKAATPPLAQPHQSRHRFSPSKPASLLPPLPPLRRTSSDPTAILPPLHRTSSDPTPAINYSNVEESPNSRRLKRMRHQLKEMSKWWDKVLHEEEEEEEENEVGDEQTKNPTEKDGSEAEDGQETVSVEEVGDCLSVQFRCPCGKGYKILLSGRNCYYKLV